MEDVVYIYVILCRNVHGNGEYGWQLANWLQLKLFHYVTSSFTAAFVKCKYMTAIWKGLIWVWIMMQEWCLWKGEEQTTVCRKITCTIEW